jgi:hypothetical protein
MLEKDTYFKIKDKIYENEKNTWFLPMSSKFTILV